MTLPRAIRLFPLLAVLAACSRDPRQSILGHWQAHTAREIYIGPDKLTWVMHGTVKMSFPYTVQSVDEDARRIELKVDVPGGLTYRIELADDYEHGTVTELVPDGATHRIERVDDRTEP